MANVIFKSNQNTVNIDFGVHASLAQAAKSKWRFDAIVSVFLSPTSGAVIIRSSLGKDYPFSFDGVNGLPVDLVDETSPTSNEHLFELISGIIN